MIVTCKLVINALIHIHIFICIYVYKQNCLITHAYIYIYVRIVGSFEEVLGGNGDSLNPSDDCSWKAGIDEQYV